MKALHYWGKSCLANNDVPHALEHLELAVKTMQRVLGADHLDTLSTLIDLGRAYHRGGRLEEAIITLEKIKLKALQTRLGKDNPSARELMLDFGEVYIDVRRTAEAIALLEKLLSLQMNAFPTPDTLPTRETLARALIIQGKPESAEVVLRDCLVRRVQQSPEAWQRYHDMSLLGNTLLNQKKYADAEPLLLKSYEGMKAREKTIPPPAANRLPEALDRLIQLYTETNKPDEVKKWQAEKDKLPKPEETKRR